jgi:hypothetical protein
MKDTERSKHEIATAASDAIKVISAAAAEAVKVASKQDGSDHDLIIKLDTKMDSLSDQIRDLKDSNTRRIDSLEKEKLNTCDSYPVLYREGVEKTLADHESRIRVNTGRIIVICTVGSAVLIIMNVIMFIVNHWY